MLPKLTNQGAVRDSLLRSTFRHVIIHPLPKFKAPAPPSFKIQLLKISSDENIGEALEPFYLMD